MDEYLRLLRDAQDALSAGADPADVDAMVLLRTGGRVTDLAMAQHVYRKLQQLEQVPAGIGHALLGAGESSSFSLLDEASGAFGALTQGVPYRRGVREARAIMHGARQQAPRMHGFGHGVAEAFGPTKGLSIGRGLERIPATAARGFIQGFGHADPNPDANALENILRRSVSGYTHALTQLSRLGVNTAADPEMWPRP